ncbi:MAG: 2-oxoglutarate dehydrogenase E1 component, partial [Sandaracinaceae bacterium]|nr:2-oxoglutarate dehydrogenase E1 component [Sandaracinaceae bacterium]
YRVRGHLYADLDPLGLLPRRGKNRPPDELGLKAFGLEDVDKRTPFRAMAQVLPLGEIVRRLEETYCRTIGAEVTQVENTEERDWLQTKMESTCNHLELTREQELHILSKLTEAEVWETFLDKAYPKKKRFSLEGGESVIPMVDLIIHRAAELGVEEIVIGMAHRGRLNMLVNIMELPIKDMLAAFEDSDPERFKGKGDVKYHLGYSTDRIVGGKRVHLTMSFNPSHLEFVNPVVEGRVRAKQDRRGDAERKRVMPILIHGDAAFIGQGIVAETLNLSRLKGYATGGTIHIVINNQIGYTTNPEDGRSTSYCTDVVRMLRCPIFHVNGEDPEAVAQVALLAAEYRQRYGKDVVIDLYCYRRHGHNEGDEPRFTQPVMYKVIDSKETVRQIYAKKLIKMGKITQEEADALVVKKRRALEEALKEVRETKRTYEVNAFGGIWAGYRGGPDAAVPDVETAVDRPRLEALLRALGRVPEGFQLMRQIAAHQKQFLDVLNGAKVRWGVAESLAYATLITEGYTVRLSGQDSRRGTFAHRHAVLFDSETGKEYVPLHHVAEALEREGFPVKRGRFEVYDSPLSEAGCLGFEWGYSLDCPDGLILWEAQFGDFANGAQVIIDQFIASSEDKWHRLSGLVLLLPHGYEGGGPEHSSARLERFLMLAAEDNVQVAYPTTAAQFFHLLRRQVLRPIRKPLVVMSPKSLFRNPLVDSPFEEFTSGRFHRIIPDHEVNPRKTKRLILCSGKVYYELAEYRRKEGRDDVAIVRFEQLYPLRAEEVRDTLASYPDGIDVVWVQEEPWNSGAWFFVHARFPQILGERFRIRCVSRPESASPATGSEKAHLLEQEELIREAFAPQAQARALIQAANDSPQKGLREREALGDSRVG